MNDAEYLNDEALSNAPDRAAAPDPAEIPAPVIPPEAQPGPQPSQESLHALEMRLREREENLLRRERRERARALLAEKGLPGQLTELVDLTDDRSAERSLDILETVFTSALSDAVSARIGRQPPKAGVGHGQDELLALRRAMGLS